MSSNSSSGKNSKGGRDDRDDDDRRERDSHGNVINGTKGGDTLYGSARNDTIQGRDGDDQLYGLAGNDNIDGGKGNDLIDGGSGNDRLYGGKGDDTLIGGLGNDHLDGGSGRDTAVFSGNYADYKIKFSNNRNRCDNDDDTVTIARKVSGSPDGSDTLKNIEVLKFDDGEFRDGAFYPTGGNTNHAPTAVADTDSAIEAGGFSNGTPGSNPTGNVLTNDDDVDVGDSKTVTTAGVFTGAFGKLTLDALGAYSYALDNANAAVQGLRTDSDTLTDTFSYTMQDTAGATSTSSLTITIHGRNDDPFAKPDAASATEAGGVANGTAGFDPTGNVLTNDTDDDAGDSKTVTVTSTGDFTGTYGVLHLNGDGSYSYALNNDNAAVQGLRTDSDTLTDTFGYTVKDTAGATSDSFLTITIHGSNDAPVANDGSALGVTGQADADDVDNTALIYSVVNQAQHGSVAMNSDGSFTYTPNLGYSGDDSFTFKANDGLADSNVGTFSLTVGSDNTAPSVENARFYISQDAAMVSGQLVATDVDGDPLTYSVADQATYGTADVDSDGIFTFVANPGGFVVGPDSASILVDDGFNGTATIEVSINIVTAGFDLIGSAGADFLIGDDGQNTASYITSTAGVTVNLATNVNSGGDAEGDSLFRIENVTGSTHDDVLTGDASSNVLDGKGGADQLDGGAGSDQLDGGAGNDTLIGGGGFDALLGGLGSDTLTGGNDGPDYFGYFNGAGDTILDLGGDTITDFNALEGDALLLADVLQGFVSSGNSAADALALDGIFLKLTVSGGGTTVEVDANGGGDSFAALVTLQGVTGLNLESLLADGNLQIF